MSGYFFEQMRALLGSRYDDFKAAYDGKPRHKALRVNTLKLSAPEFALLCEKYEAAGVREYGLRKNPLCENGFYTCVRPSADPLYHAGLYYMQEPSAQAAVSAFAPFIGKRVLDLCAAPGGKSTQAAAYMTGGVIFCNDAERKRVRALGENIVRLGIRNAVVTCAKASDYRAAGLDGYFDTLIVDAPCSGGGMMRYETVPYTADIVAGCAGRQRAILDDAAELLCEGGYMLYSTCTFAPEEDEQNVRYLLEKGFKTVDIPLREGEERGVDMPDARRIYPHNYDGEGHFYCVLQKTAPSGEPVRAAKRGKLRTVSACGLTLTGEDRNSSPAIIGFEMPFLTAECALNRCIVSVGVPIFERCAAGKQPEPSHALVHALTADELRAANTVELDEAAAQKYMRGEQLDIAAPRGDSIVTVEGYALGRARSAPDGAGGSALKNLYPKALRI